MTRVVRVVLVAAAVALVAVACSSDSKKTATAGAPQASASKTPEDLRATAGEVAAGLRKIDSTAKQIATAAGTDKARAKELAGQIEPVWKAVEGTVKANDPDAYISFEDSFAVLAKAADDGDAAKAQQGADAVAKAVTAYLAKYPG